MSELSRSSEQPHNDCDTLRDLIPAYVLGAADIEERIFVEAKLADCPEVAVEMENYLALTQAMLFTAPPAEPPARLFENLMAATSEPSTAVPAVPEVDTIEQPRFVPVKAGKRPAAPQPSWLQQLAELFTGRRQGLGIAMAGLAVVLFLVSNIYWMVQLGQIRSEQTMLSGKLEEQEILLQALGTSSVNKVEMRGEDATYASVAWTTTEDKKAWIALLSAENLPALTPGQIYQLWLIRDDQPLSVGLFSVDQNGKGVLVFRTTEPIGTFEQIGVTAEPASGSSQPTTSPVVIGQI